MNGNRNALKVLQKHYFCLPKGKESKEMEGQKIQIQAIINPISGVGSKRKIPKMIRETFSGENQVVNVSFTQYPGHASELTWQAIERGVHCVIAVGGDGTVNEVARAMLHSDAVLGIIPKGSGNGLARELHIPMDARRALELIVKGIVRPLIAVRRTAMCFFVPVAWDSMRRLARSLPERKGEVPLPI